VARTGPDSAGEARALLARGALPDAARAFAASMARDASGRFSLQVLVACDPENVQKAVSAVPAQELFVLPVNVKGRACYRLCWGVYDSRTAAEAALPGLPSYFRQGGATPRLSPLTELLP
jgi:septal ring-binding cell division protein DamX